MDNGHIESFNGRLRDECLNVNQFLTIEDARAKIEAWRLDYNHHRAHGSLGYLTPSEFIQDRQDKRIWETAAVQL
jgi:putative transposase